MKTEIGIGQYVQQGDVIITRISNLPEGLTKLDTTVLQESEITGHHHHFLPDAPVKVYQGRDTDALEEIGRNAVTRDMDKFIEVMEEAVLFHGTDFSMQPQLKGTGDHEGIALPPGIYSIGIARIYDYASGEVKKVVD